MGTRLRIGLKRRSLIHCVGGSTWTNYKKIYDDDEYLKELDEGARVWRVYNDESDKADAEMVDGWRNTLNTLFIFVSIVCFVHSKFIKL